MKKENSQKQERAKKIMEKPVRVRILDWLCSEKKSKTKREIGKALSLSNAAVHQHMKLLEEAELVKLTGTRPGPNSITEKLYIADCKYWEEIRSIGDPGLSYFYLKYTMENIKELHREGEAIINSDADRKRFTVGCHGVYCSLEEMEKLNKKIRDLVSNFYQKHQKPKKGSIPWALTYGIVPYNPNGWKATQCVFDMLDIKK